jgi:sterol desaturase/sphingolipid hydroxylase (fatty acid hydroxylase superfamily)/protein-tyrosine-phosphatase
MMILGRVSPSQHGGPKDSAPTGTRWIEVEARAVMTEFFSADSERSHIVFVRIAIPVSLLVCFWCWETWWPFFGSQSQRLQHAARNLSLAFCNTLLLALAFSAATVAVVEWTSRNQFGLLNANGLGATIRWLLALVLLDGWMYVWHRANHSVPLLWRFHRMHHSDRNMDVTTASRFHLGEHVGSSVLRLGLIPLLGFEVWNLVVYDTLVIAVIIFHHADISIGRWDRWLQLFIVTPYMHKIHHSDWRPETDSNYSTVLSVWDRLAGSLRTRSELRTIDFGLAEFTDPSWQSWWGMWKTPFVNPKRKSDGRVRVLFVCNENCNRSQMAEAFARIYGADWLEAYSAGYNPAETVHPKAIAAMRELGYDLQQHFTKGLSELPDVEFDVAVTLCEDCCLSVKAKQRENWNMPVPKCMQPEQFRAVRDQIGKKVKELLVGLKKDTKNRGDEAASMNPTVHEPKDRG